MRLATKGHSRVSHVLGQAKDDSWRALCGTANSFDWEWDVPDSASYRSLPPLCKTCARIAFPWPLDQEKV